MIKTISAIALSLALTSLAVHAEEATKVVEGKKSIEQLTATCVACHGTDGNSPTPANPNLAGQHRDYLLISMQRYQSGERKNAVMTGLLAGLSEQDLKTLALYYSRQKGLWDTAFPRFK